MNALIYDLEIINAVPGKNEPIVDGITYCQGWHDHAGMGISVICAYDAFAERYRVFCKDNFDEFKRLCTMRETLVSFNGLGFDNKVIQACLGWAMPDRCYDVLAEMWDAAGLEKSFRYPSHIGFSLDASAKANLSDAKSGNGGAMAPIEWQRGNIGAVIDYCLQDIRLTRGLLDRIRLTGGLRDPRQGDRFLAFNSIPAL